MDAKTSEWRPGPSVCRCCLTEGCYKDISTEYFWMGKREVYAEMLSETLNVSISYSQAGGPNSNSRLICEPCISRLRDASDFRRQVVECEKSFMQHLDPCSSMADIEVNLEPLGDGVKLECVKLEKSLSDDDYDDRCDFPDDDDDDDDLDDQPLTKLASRIPKKETVDIIDIPNTTKSAEKRKSTTKIKLTPVKKTKVVKIEPMKAGVSKMPTKVAGKLSTKVGGKAASKTTQKTTEKKKKERIATLNIEEKSRSDPVIHNSIIMLRHTTAYPVLQSQRVIRCSFCPYDTEDPEQLRQHLDSHDNIDKATSLNGKVIYTRVDITNLACHACGDKFETLEAAASHLHNKHNMSLDLDASLGLVPLRLERNKFECVVCQRKYTGFKALYRHAGEHYTTRVCDMCGRKFETKPALENHIARNHLAILCKMCKMSFESVEARRQHVRESEKCRPFACTMCPVRFFSWDHRQNHLESVHKRPKMVFPCKECSEIFSNRQMLYFHFKKKHTDDCVCSFCGKHFKARRELSQHLAMHTGIRPWKCEVCDKAFGGPKSLGNHMRIHDDSKKSKCTLCGRLFVGASKLKGHFQKRHPDAYSEHYS